MQGFLKSLHRTYSTWQQHSQSSLAKELSQLSILGRIDEAIRILRQIPNLNSYQLDSDSYLPLIRSCIKFKAFGKGREIHEHIIKNGVQPNLVLQNNIVMMYSKSGESELAQKVFDEMCERNLFSWTAIIGVYSNNGDLAKAVDFYEKMILEGIKADNFLYPIVLKSCAGMKNLRSGRRVHADIITSGFQWDLFIMNSLVDMYAKCGSLWDAERVFYECDVKDIFTWTTMLVGYVQFGCGQEALELFKEMMRSEVKPQSATFSAIFPLFSGSCCLDMAKQIHGLAIAYGCGYDKYCGTSLIDMYANCGGLGYGRLIFDRVRGRDVVSWNIMIKGYFQLGFVDEAMELFEGMLMNGIIPNKITFEYITPLYLQSRSVLDLIQHLEYVGLASSIVSANLLDHVCEHIDDIKQANELHRYLNKKGYMSDNSVVAALIRMYSKCSDTEAAQEVFNSLNAKDLDCWNAIIECHAYNRHTNKALELFHSMRKAGIKPNILSWNTVIAGFVDIGDFNSALQMYSDMIWTNQNPNLRSFDIIIPLIQYNTCSMTGKELHCTFLRNEGEMSKFVCTAFINMYGNCGDVAYAVNLFESMDSKDMVSWNTIISVLAKNKFVNEASKTFYEMKKAGVAGNIITWTTMVSGYAHNGLVDESLNHFRKLQLEGLRPNSITIASILPACAQSATLSHGKSIHGYTVRNGLDDEDLMVTNALVDMYFKCGCLKYAEQLFSRLPQRDVVSWNTMIQGFAVYGNAKAALALFDQMLCAGEIPDSVTFIGVLSACSHAGLVSEGWKQFNSMESKYGIIPSGKHYSCMVDILGRGGQFKDVRDFIVQMPLQPTASLWGALLSACKTHGNVEMAEYAANCLIELQPDNPGNYVVLSNIYAKAGRWNDVDRVRKLMTARGVKKSPGGSWIEIGNNIYTFAVDNLPKQEMEEVYTSLLDLAAIMVEEGYVPDVNTISFEDMEEG
ncbi:hypothetical protein AQUCO_02600309v1 [Aquilegia coerulea]|uniref:Pentacotripeptide-repeat region of PRORP domain-containing protein n=1 Tax=Aquilegia coerulea TaxID=218851 RepID=A0A2G5D8B8_AQUCA|nr:hypothetical protein AQUCO_02600309v1 [Aquilegia coerulea]